jgi:hypothetical protein
MSFTSHDPLICGQTRSGSTPPSAKLAWITKAADPDEHRGCERAGAWQILVSESLYEALPVEIRSGFERTEPMQFKNVTQFMATYRFTVSAAVNA